MAKVVRKGNTYLYVYITKKQKTAFDKVAKKKGTTQSALMRTILEEYLSKFDEKKVAWF